VTLETFAKNAIKIRDERDALKARVAELEAQVAEWQARTIREGEERDRLREALKSIAEYWNQDQNESAMADACWHAINTARVALAGPAPEGGGR
jgi:cell division septum initiation protein DivIVA